MEILLQNGEERSHYAGTRRARKAWKRDSRVRSGGIAPLALWRTGSRRMPLEKKRTPGRRELVLDPMWEEGPGSWAERRAGRAGRSKDCWNTQVNIVHMSVLSQKVPRRLKKKKMIFLIIENFQKDKSTIFPLMQTTCEFRDTERTAFFHTYIFYLYDEIGIMECKRHYSDFLKSVSIFLFF